MIYEQMNMNQIVTKTTTTTTKSDLLIVSESLNNAEQHKLLAVR